MTVAELDGMDVNGEEGGNKNEGGKRNNTVSTQKDQVM